MERRVHQRPIFEKGGHNIAQTGNPGADGWKFWAYIEPETHYVAAVMQSDWQTQFKAVYARGVAAWEAGRNSPDTMFDASDVAFLETIGCSAQELFDFIDDWLRYGEPDFKKTLAVTAIRRDYFLNVLHGKPTGHTASMDDLPAKTAAVDGIAWLPRLIEKARLKLRGEMPADLMFGCGGDRQFLQSVSMTEPQFLKLAWECGTDHRRLIDAVKKSAGGA